MKYTDRAWRATSASVHYSDDHGQRLGYAVTPKGVVGFWSSQALNVARLTFVLDGVEHCRRFNKFYTARYLITLARRFAADIAMHTTTQEDK